MHCKHCGFANGEDDHRCLRCGRRIGVAIAAPHGYSGANALAVAPAFDNESQELFSDAAHSASPGPGPKQPVQTPLFVESALAPPHAKIIPFDQIQRQRVFRSSIVELPVQETVKAQSQPRPAVKRTVAPAAEQTRIDFIPAAPSKARASKDNVEAVIFCDQQVALPMHRFVAASVDAALILLGFGAFLTIFLGLGCNFGEGRMFWIVMASCFGVVALFYGCIWAMMGRETPGMQSVGLELVTFDGLPVEGSSRALRYCSTVLSFCSAGLGLLWSLVDEENLTWHDHISKTFPSVREVPRNFVRR